MDENKGSQAGACRTGLEGRWRERQNAMASREDDKKQVYCRYYCGERGKNDRRKRFAFSSPRTLVG